MHILIIFILTVFGIVSLAVPVNDPLAQGKNGAVASENAVCSKIGVDVLKDGGSAIDAVIATTICIGTVNFQSSGIGGGGFMVYRSNNETFSINFRETAPALAFTDMYKNRTEAAQTGGLSVGIPGELRGLEAAHKRGGKLSWKRLLAPSIAIARTGWKVSPRLGSIFEESKQAIMKDRVLRNFLAPNGRILKAGEWISRPNYAKALESIANDGVDVFYKGWIAEALLKTIKEYGGIITAQDLKDYKALVETPVISSYRGARIITTPPPSSGPVLVTILNVLENYNITTLDDVNMHRMVEAFKHAYAQRGYYGDPIDPIYRNISEIANHFTTKETANDITLRIKDNNTFEPSYYKPKFAVQETPGTMHVSLMTGNGEAVALTSTINLLFGSKVMDEATGIFLNDEMDDFSIPGVSNAFGYVPSPYNYIHPGKRPLSSSVPTIVDRDGHVIAVAGASGGSRIITSTLQTLVRLLDLKQSALDAVNEYRVHHQLLPHEIWAENEIPKDIQESFERRGHKVKVAAKGVFLSGVSAIKRLKDGTIQGAGDWRKEGFAYAY